MTGTSSSSLATRFGIISLTALLFIAGFLFGAPRSRATFAGANGPIFFRQGKNIYGVPADGGDRTLIARGRAFNGVSLRDVAPNPAGTKIAFSTSSAIWIGTVGGGARNLTKDLPGTLNLSGFRFPAWSPTGKKLVFQATRKQNGIFTPRLYRINSDGTGIKQLHKFSNQVGAGDPDWSSDDKIVFVEVLDDLWTMNPDGSDKEQLTTDDENYSEPSWSPDGEKLAALGSHSTHSVTAPHDGVVVVDAATGVGTELTGPGDTEEWIYSPTWSPDGQEVAFVFEDAGTGEPRAIHTMSSTPGPPGFGLELYLGTSDVFEPAWSVAP